MADKCKEPQSAIYFEFRKTVIEQSPCLGYEYKEYLSVLDVFFGVTV